MEVKDYIVDYLSEANRDIMLVVEGMYTETYRYDPWSQRVSVELDYAAETTRGEAGENLGSDIATGDMEKVWYRRSHLSSTLYAGNADGEVAFHLQYDEWGKPETDILARQNHAGIDNLNNFTGYTYDDVLGIYFAQNRFYDAEIMRFTQEDPVRSGMNWFAYVGNNPINGTDPWGLYDPDQPTYNYYEDINTLVAEAGGKITYMGGLTGWQGYEVNINGYSFKIQTDDHNIDYDSILTTTASNGSRTKSIRYKIQNVWFGRDSVQLFAYDFNQLLGGGSSKGQGGAGRGGSNDTPPTTVIPVPTPKPEDGGYQEQLGGEYRDENEQAIKHQYYDFSGGRSTGPIYTDHASLVSQINYIDPRFEVELANFKSTYLEHLDEYTAIAAATDMPPELVAAIHYRESTCNFNTYLHNGDPLGKPTTNVPKGIMFDSFTDAAIDAQPGVYILLMALYER